MKKTTMPGMPEVEVVEIKTSAPVNVLADPAPAKKPAAKRTRKTAAAKTTAAKTEAKKPAAKRGRKPKAATAAAKKAEGPKKPTALIIMDGFGHREETKGNAIEAAKKPNLDKIFAENPLTYIGASGLDVGLPDGQMGNSEVGHTNIGAGRIVYQELTRITKAIQDGDFFENPALMSAINQCKWFGSTLHIFGLRLTAVCIPTLTTCLRCSSWHAAMVCARFASTASWTAATRRRSPVSSISTACRPRSTLSRSAASQPYPAVTTQWIVITAGIAYRRRTTLSHSAKASTLLPHTRLWSSPTQTA